ncbi:MAG: acylphosphatase [Thermoplasmata archaeon]
MLVRAYVRFTGLVQGVNFRYYTKIRARELGLTGYVKNEMDGSVTAVFEGPKEKVMECIQWCEKHQPHAEVESCEIKWEDIEEKRYTSFEIVH